MAVALVALGACSADEGVFGGELYERRCASCHDIDGSGGRGPALGADSMAVELSDDQINGVIRVGPGAMPSFDYLTDEQIDSLVDHIRSLQSGP